MATEQPVHPKAGTSTKETSPLLTILVSFFAALLMARTPLWQLALVAGALGGGFCPRMKWGAITGCVGTALGWLAYMGISFLATQSYVLLGQVAGIIFKSTSMSGVLILLVALVGALLGTLGGSIGSGVRILIDARKSR